jgi:hypothetical protein
MDILPLSTSITIPQLFVVALDQSLGPGDGGGDGGATVKQDSAVAASNRVAISSFLLLLLYRHSSFVCLTVVESLLLNTRSVSPPWQQSSKVNAGVK